jgi:tetratricopeptide (TPR) repeat protein
MELVEGKPLMAYASSLDEAARLRLFLDVCGAVQYAHRCLVVHRDLKPANIFVTTEGQVKLLDFGIAKVLDSAAGREQTRGIAAFSPSYASPEQLLGQPVTTSTDIYSLGVLLCELLTGRPPCRLDSLTLEEMVDEARRPLRDLPLGGDLGAIARKALEFDPARRYESAGALARDVRRYLGGQPVEARDPSWTYRAGKFLRRHRYAVAAASLTALSLFVALGYAVWQAQRAEFRFNQVRELARAIMFELHDEISRLPGSLAARKLVVDHSMKYLDTLAADTSAGAEVRLDLAKGYLRLAEIEGKDLGGASLGRSDDALRHSLLAANIARSLAAQAPQDLAVRRLLVDALDSATTALTLRGESAKAITHGEEAVRLAEQLARELPHSEEDLERLATVTKQLADAYSKSTDRAKALPLFVRNLEIRRGLQERAPEAPARQQRLAEAHLWLTSELWWSQDFTGSERHAREAFRLDEARYAVNPRGARANLASDAVLLAMLAARGKRYEEAVGYAERALQLRRQIAQEDPNSATAALRVAASLNRLSLIYRDWGRSQEAMRLGQEAVELAQSVSKKDPNNVAAAREVVFALSDLARTYHQAGRSERACRLAAQALALSGPAAQGQGVQASLERMRELAAGCGVHFTR